MLLNKFIRMCASDRHKNDAHLLYKARHNKMCASMSHKREAHEDMYLLFSTAHIYYIYVFIESERDQIYL